MISKWTWIMMISVASKSATCKAQGFKKLVIHSIWLIVQKLGLDL